MIQDYAHTSDGTFNSTLYVTSGAAKCVQYVIVQYVIVCTCD